MRVVEGDVNDITVYNAALQRCGEMRAGSEVFQIVHHVRRRGICFDETSISILILAFRRCTLERHTKSLLQTIINQKLLKNIVSLRDLGNNPILLTAAMSAAYDTADAPWGDQMMKAHLKNTIKPHVFATPLYLGVLAGAGRYRDVFSFIFHYNILITPPTILNVMRAVKGKTKCIVCSALWRICVRVKGANQMLLMTGVIEFLLRKRRVVFGQIDRIVAQLHKEGIVFDARLYSALCKCEILRFKALLKRKGRSHQTERCVILCREYATKGLTLSETQRRSHLTNLFSTVLAAPPERWPSEKRNMQGERGVVQRSQRVRGDTLCKAKIYVAPLLKKEGKRWLRILKSI